MARLTADRAVPSILVLVAGIACSFTLVFHSPSLHPPRTAVPDGAVVALAAIAAILELVGGLALAFGKEEFGAQLLLVFLLPTTSE